MKSDTPPTFHFFLEGVGKVKTDRPTMSGAAIKTITRTPMNYALYVSERPSIDGRPLRDAEALDLRTTVWHLFAVPPGTMGG